VQLATGQREELLCHRGVVLGHDRPMFQRYPRPQRLVRRSTPSQSLVVNLLMSLFVLPRVYTGFLAEPRFGETSLSAGSGAWSVVTALAIASLVLAVIHHKRLPELRKTLDAGANASVLPAWSSRDQRPLYGPAVQEPVPEATSGVRTEGRLWGGENLSSFLASRLSDDR
jgi:hypothetical protein